MAIFSSTGASAPHKSLSVTFPPEGSSLVNGLVQHALISPSTQVQILSVVDATGSATLGDIVIELPDHPDPVGAVLLMVDAGILTAEVAGVVDAFTLVRRSGPRNPIDGEPHDDGPEASMSSVDISSSIGGEPGIEAVKMNPFSAAVFVGAGDQRRDFARLEAVRRPGIYVLMNDIWAYVGTGADVGARVANGRQPIVSVDTVVAIVDANCALTADDAKALERIMWSRLAGSGERRLINGVPDGYEIDPERYNILDAMVAQACLALRHRGILFTQGSMRSVLSGPRAEPQRIGSVRPFNAVPDGEIFEMNFGAGLVALAAKQSDDLWVLLRGSDIRMVSAASASASVGYLRSAWLHSGLLTLAPDGKSYTVMRDLVFGSGSAAAQFCCGSKGRGLAGWQPIDPDGGYDPDTPVLIVS